jgi:hypothetical protein
VLGILELDGGRQGDRNKVWRNYGLPISLLKGKFCVAPIDGPALQTGLAFFMPYTHFTDRD